MDIPGVAADGVAPRDNRIYENSKGRPVGIAAMFNRITNTLEHSEMTQSMTPEDKRMLDRLFTRCIGHAEAYLRAQRQAAKKRAHIIMGSCHLYHTQKLDSALENHPIRFQRILIQSIEIQVAISILRGFIHLSHRGEIFVRGRQFTQQ